VLPGGVPDEAIDHVAPALHASETGTVKSALKLLPRSAHAALIAAEALAQAPGGAQLELLAFVERITPLDPAVASALSRAASNVAPALRQRLLRLLPTPELPRRDDPTTPLRVVARAATPPGHVESLDELVHVLACVLESAANPHELERALDGVSRHCERSATVLRQLEPVARRASKLLTKSRDRPFSGTSPRADMAGLVNAWASGEAPRLPPLDDRSAVPTKSVLGFLSYRVLEVAARAARGEPQPLLSLPTLAGGGIDPPVLAARRAELERLGLAPGAADAIQAALRAGEIPRSSEYRFSYGPQLKSFTYQGNTSSYSWFYVRVTPPCPDDPPLDRVPDLFLAALSSTSADYSGMLGERSSDAVRWVATVWPGNREPYYAKGAAELGANIDWWEARWHVRHFLEPLLLPTEPIGEMGCLLLALGLGAKEPGERTLARDVLVGAVGDGRLDVAALGSTLARLYSDSIVKGSRIAASLTDTAGVSIAHTDAMATLIEYVLSGLEGPPPKDLSALLGALSDYLAQLHHEVRLPRARVYLRNLRGSSKSAALARSLLAAGESTARVAGADYQSLK